MPKRPTEKTAISDTGLATEGAIPLKGLEGFTRPPDDAVRLQLHALAYNLGNFMRTLALPDAVAQWSLTSLREKLIKIGAKIVRHGRYVTFQMAEVAIPRDLFADILRRIDRLRPNMAPA